MQQSTGYCPSMKWIWEEAIVIYKEMIEKVKGEKERAVIGKGRYQLVSAYKHLEMSLLNWFRWIQVKKWITSGRHTHLGKTPVSFRLVVNLRTSVQLIADSMLGRFGGMGLPNFSAFLGKMLVKSSKSKGLVPSWTTGTRWPLSRQRVK